MTRKELFALVALLVLLWIILPAVAALFLSVLLIWAFLRLDPRILTAALLLLLAIIPAMVALGSDATADMIAIFALSLFPIILFLEWLRYVRDGRAVAYAAPPPPPPSPVQKPVQKVSKKKQPIKKKQAKKKKKGSS